VAAVYAAEKTGKGRDVEVNLIDTAFSMLTYLAIWNLNRGFKPVRQPGSAHQSLVPVQTFRTRDGHLVIFCAKESFWQKLCTILQLERLLIDERFTSFSKRFKNRKALVSALQKTFLTRTTEDWLKLLRGKVPCAPVNDLSQAMREPLLVDQRMIVETPHSSFGTIRQVASPIRLPGTSMNHHRAPGLGEHTTEILKQYLEYDDNAIADLRRREIV
jgi:crotonobetainyl-CoA:carnitine CoA-transferase CaiB-like acyl-CoA transferase